MKELRTSILGIIVGLLSLVTSCENGRDFDTSQLRPNIVDTLRILEKHNAIPGTVVGPNGRPSKYLETTDWFQENINSSEAEVLFYHNNSFIKAMAFIKMCRDGNPNVFDIIINSYSDTTLVYEKSGCEVFPTIIFDYYLKTVRYPYILSIPNARFTQGQIVILDSMAQTHEYWREYNALLKINPTNL
jgi:hypothetical protein